MCGVRLDRMRLPTAKEINPIPESLDGRVAQRHFLGKTEAEAFAMFKELFEVYQEDLMWMGAQAFLFYFPVACRYAESEEARNDPAVAGIMLMLMRFRCRYEWPAVVPLLPQMAAYCDGVLTRVGHMVIDRNINGNLKDKYERFLNKLRAEPPCSRQGRDTHSLHSVGSRLALPERKR